MKGLDYLMDVFKEGISVSPYPSTFLSIYEE